MPQCSDLSAPYYAIYIGQWLQLQYKLNVQTPAYTDTLFDLQPRSKKVRMLCRTWLKNKLPSLAIRVFTDTVQ